MEPISNIISNKLVLKCVDFAPPKRGQPMYVPDAVTTAVLDYCRMLTAHRIPVFKSTVLGTFRRLVDGTPMCEKFKVDGDAGGGGVAGGVGGSSRSWDMNALENWYTKRFLDD